MKKNKKNCERPTIDFELSTKDMLEVMVKGTAVSCKLVYQESIAFWEEYARTKEFEDSLVEKGFKK